MDVFVKTLKRLASNCEHLRELLQDYSTCKQKGSPFTAEFILKKLEKEYQKTESLAVGLKEISQFISQELDGIARTKQDYIVKLGNVLVNALPQMKISGRLPLLKVGILTLEIQAQRDMACIWYGPQYDLIEKIKLSKTDLALEIKKVYESLETQGRKSADLLKVVFQAYLRAIKEKGQKIGEPIGIGDVFPFVVWGLQKNVFWQSPKRTLFNEYPKYQFSFDLFRTTNRVYNGEYELRLTVATREQTKNKSCFLWIPINWHGEGCCFANLEFKKIA